MHVCLWAYICVLCTRVCVCESTHACRSCKSQVSSSVSLQRILGTCSLTEPRLANFTEQNGPWAPGILLSSFPHHSDYRYTHTLFPMGSGGPNSDSQACTTITLPTGPSPQPSLLSWFCFLKSQTTFQPHEPFPGDESNPAMSFSYHMWGNWRTEKELLLLKVTQRLESKLSLSHN